MYGGSEEELNAIESRVLERVKPKKEDYELLHRVVVTVVNELRELLASERIEAQITVEGSFAKDTWLRTDPEADIFVILPSCYEKGFIRDVLHPKLKSSLQRFSPQELFSEHPYLTFSLHGVKVDVVPAIAPTGEGVKTVADRTHLHTEFVLKTTDERLRDQIRLAKAFAKGVGVYGAEVRVRGFSGYLLELLTIHYGSFRGLLRAASREWVPGKVLIDLKGYYTDEGARRVFGPQPMIVVDPVDPKRNAAAAVSLEKMAEFIMASRLYLKRPSSEFFFPKPLHPMEEKRLLSLAEGLLERTVVLLIELKERIPPDNLWGELGRSARNLRGVLEDSGFTVYRCSVWSNERDRAAVACIIGSPTRDVYKLVKGPPVGEAEHAMRFVDKYVNVPFVGPWVEGDRLYALSVCEEVLATSVVEKGLTGILVSDLARMPVKVALLSWVPELLEEDEMKTWLLELLLGKPRWLWPWLSYRKTAV